MNRMTRVGIAEGPNILSRLCLGRGCMLGRSTRKYRGSSYLVVGCIQSMMSRIGEL